MRQEHISKTELTGRNIKLVQVLYDSLAITDTNAKDTTVNLEGAEKYLIVIRSTLDQSLTFELRDYMIGNNLPMFKSNGTTPQLRVTIPVGSIAMYLGADEFPILTQALETFGTRVYAGTAPTSGSLTIKLYSLS